MTYCFDLDNTLCNTTGNDYDSCTPINSMIEKVNHLYDSGHKIVIFTARGMSKFSRDSKLIHKNFYQKTKTQLKDWKIKHHELVLGKPTFDFVIDDKNISIQEFKKIVNPKVGFLAGSFDLIHPGYIKMFHFSKQHCDHLIVALQTDPTIERPNKIKPILSVDERKLILSSIKYVDEVLTYDKESDLITIMENNRIDLRFLGDDYIGQKYTGFELNIPVIYVDRSHGWSTTKLKRIIK